MFVVLAFLVAVAGPGGRAWGSPLFLVDPERIPRVTISWPTRDGRTVTLEADREYTAPGQKSFLGKNLECFVALGGTRLDRGAGHPEGLIVRVGFYKVDAAELMFEGIADGGRILVTLRNVRFNRPPVPRRQTALQHLKYMAADIEACGWGQDAMDQFNTLDPTDTMNGLIPPENVRLGALGEAASGSVEVRREADGSVSLTAGFAYRLLRHLRDPWLRETPGAFLEPQHFHIEFEVLPEGAGPAPVRLRPGRVAVQGPLLSPGAADGPGVPPALGPVVGAEDFR